MRFFAILILNYNRNCTILVLLNKVNVQFLHQVHEIILNFYGPVSNARCHSIGQYKF